MKEEAKRNNEGKNRLDLVPPILQEEVGKVMTFGAQKYEPYNWAKGMKWSKCIASLKRHLSAFEKGEDFDPETGLYHLAHIGCNILFLLDYYKNHPELDDRLHSYLKPSRIGLDIDEVICDFTTGWHKVWNEDPFPTSWNYDWHMGERFKQMEEEGSLIGFYLGLQPKIDPKEIPFEPCCYVTSRPIPTEETEKWLKMHKFPKARVITVPINTSKIDAIKSANIDIFVDDRYENFIELNKAGICTFLFDAPHNQRYPVGYKRIRSLKELV